MTDWIIQPFESLGPLNFGASRGEVREVLDEPPREFAKGAATILSEAYNGAGLHAHYDDAGQLELIEAFDPCRPVYASVPLLARDVASVLGSLSALGLVPRADGEGGFWFDDQGFALYAPAEASEGVSVFRRGYDTGV
jgi:hypothetical protein